MQHQSQQENSNLMYSDALFEKWPPPAEMDGRLVRDDVDQIKAEMRGQPMQGPRPTNEELKRWGLTCVEQYHIYDTYWCW